MFESSTIKTVIDIYGNIAIVIGSVFVVANLFHLKRAMETEPYTKPFKSCKKVMHVLTRMNAWYCFTSICCFKGIYYGLFFPMTFVQFIKRSKIYYLTQNWGYIEPMVLPGFTLIYSKSIIDKYDDWVNF